MAMYICKLLLDKRINWCYLQEITIPKCEMNIPANSLISLIQQKYNKTCLIPT